MADLSRRRLLGFLAAPAIVRAASLMPVKLFVEPLVGHIVEWRGIEWTVTGDGRLFIEEATRRILMANSIHTIQQNLWGDLNGRASRAA